MDTARTPQRMESGPIQRNLRLPDPDGEWHVLKLPADIQWYHLRSIDVILLRRQRQGEA